MTGRFETSVQVLDFGREIEIGVTDTQNPTRHMRIRVPELHLEEVSEMLHALADQLDLVLKGEDPKEIKEKSFDRLVAAFEEGVSEAQADPAT